MTLLQSAVRFVISAGCVVGLLLGPSVWAVDASYVVKPIAEMRVKQLPKGPLYWRIEKFSTLGQAKAAATNYRWNPDTVSYDGWPSLTADAAGSAWLFTFGAKGATSPNATKVAKIGPVPSITAPEYLLRINYGSGPPGAKTTVHSHFGSEAFYVIAGQLGQKTPLGISYVEAGHTINGHMAGMTMQVFNAGTTDLTPPHHVRG